MKRLIMTMLIAITAGCAGMQDRCTKDAIDNTYYEVCRASNGTIESKREMTSSEVKSHLKRKQRSEQAQGDFLTNPTMLFIGYDMLKSSQPRQIEIYHYGLPR